MESPKFEYFSGYRGNLIKCKIIDTYYDKSGKIAYYILDTTAFGDFRKNYGIANCNSVILKSSLTESEIAEAIKIIKKDFTNKKIYEPERG